MSLNLPPEIGLLNTCLLLTSFLMATPKTLLDGCVLFFFLTELESLWVLNAQRRKSSWCNYRKWPQGSSTSSCVTFFFFLTVISLLFSIGIESTSDVVFASSVQKLSLIIYGHLYFLFYVLFCIEVITVYSINFPLLFSSSFFIFWLYINVYMLTPNS